jgi:hypothetical protein
LIIDTILPFQPHSHSNIIIYQRRYIVDLKIVPVLGTLGS